MAVEVAELEVAAAVAGREESFTSVCSRGIFVSGFSSDSTWSIG